MRFFSICAGLAGLTASAMALTITSPSASSYWVQFSTNTIAWSLSSGDPTLVTLQIINTNTTQLNGVFAIAEYVKASLESFTITNVTLVVAEGYAVQMVNPLNNTQVYATSGTFGVRPSGTSPAPVTSSNGQTGSTSASGTTGTNSTNNRNTTVAGSSVNNGTANTNARASSACTRRMPVVVGILAAATAAFCSALL